MRIVKVGTALSMGLMAGFLFSLKQVHPSIELRFGLSSVAAFLVAGAAAWRFCTALARSVEKNDPGRNRFMIRWMIGFIGLSGLGTLAAFGYALKNVSSDSRRDVIEGTLIAVIVLAVGLWLIRKAFHFFEEQSEAELEQQRRNHEEHERGGKE